MHSRIPVPLDLMNEIHKVTNTILDSGALFNNKESFYCKES